MDHNKQTKSIEGMSEHDKYNVEDFDYLKNAACDTDMTGLIYRAITDDEEIESYEEVYQYLPPTKKQKE